MHVGKKQNIKCKLILWPFVHPFTEQIRIDLKEVHFPACYVGHRIHRSHCFLYVERLGVRSAKVLVQFWALSESVIKTVFSSIPWVLFEMVSVVRFVFPSFLLDFAFAFIFGK
jgi:hypothetical protein